MFPNERVCSSDFELGWCQRRNNEEQLFRIERNHIFVVEEVIIWHVTWNHKNRNFINGLMG